MTDQYSIAETRHDLAAIVRKLEKQPRIEITRRGKTVAVLLSIEEYQRLATPHPRFWQAYEQFRQGVDLADLKLGPEIFEGLRSSETGRDVDLT